MYSLVTSQMTWSYSRLTAFETCPYRFFLKYLYGCDEKPEFFSQFGSFAHEIHQLVFISALKREEAAHYYLTHFAEQVTERAPSEQIFSSYFQGGLSYFKNMPEFEGSTLGIETEFRFEIEGIPFIGFPDLFTRTCDGICLYDHKARTLKPRSNRKKPTLADKELDKYLRQLYLYSIPIKEKYGEYPTRLVFNCYRAGYFVTEPFIIEKLEETKQWAVSTVREIIKAADWPPSLDFFRCRNLCGLESDCSYFSFL